MTISGDRSHNASATLLAVVPKIRAAVSPSSPAIIVATLVVMVSFLPMLFITGMMGPYMQPMALNVPIAMLMSMVVAFTITPWLAYHVLGRRFRRDGEDGIGEESAPADSHGLYDVAATQRTMLYRMFRPLMLPLLRSRAVAAGFLLATAVATVIPVVITIAAIVAVAAVAAVTVFAVLLAFAVIRGVLVSVAFVVARAAVVAFAAVASSAALLGRDGLNQLALTHAGSAVDAQLCGGGLEFGQQFAAQGLGGSVGHVVCPSVY